MFTIQHSSWQCNIPFDKVSDHNSHIQVCNATCKMTIHRVKGRSNIRGDTFYQRRNNSTCDVTIQDVRWRINHQGNNSTCDVTIWTCNVTMQHSTPQYSTCLWELGIKTAGVARARELDPPRVLFQWFSGLFPSLFSLLSLRRPSSL